MKTGLTSVTFLKLSAKKIVELTAKAGLDGIEWGGDIHVPHGDLKIAKMVKDLTENAGLKVSSYGSYYRVYESEKTGLAFEDVLSTAVELNAPTIRVWAGGKGSADASSEYRENIIKDLCRIGSMAQIENITIALEFHGGTLADTAELALKLMKETAHPNVRLYWQHSLDRSFDNCCKDLKMLIDYVSNIHVFYYMFPNEKGQRALVEGKREWSEYFNIAESQNKERYVLLEFVRKGSEEQFFEDAQILRDMTNN